MAVIDLDSKINWRGFYGGYLKEPMKPSGTDKLSGHCPFHDDRHESFWINTGNGFWKCEAGCGSGSAATFLARKEKVSAGEAFRRLCREAGLPEQKASGKTGKSEYTLAAYAEEKRLPAPFLASLGLTDGYGKRYVEIPYRNEKGEAVALRKRFAPGGNPRFLWRKGDKPMLYGLWRMGEIRAAGYAILAEGESDAQTLWFLGFCALGIPGAANFSVRDAAALGGIPLLYLHIEPDQGGKTVRRNVLAALRQTKYAGAVRTFACSAHQGAKDPSALFLLEDSKAADIIGALLKGAETETSDAGAISPIAGLEDAPAHLQIPSGFDMNERGIYRLDPRAQEMESEPFCWTPIVITRVLPSDRGDIKVELAFRRDGKWHMADYPRSTLASSQAITKLADAGVDVHTENAGSLARFLSALECRNINHIPSVQRFTHYGWIGGGQFLPGAVNGEYVIDGGNGTGAYAEVGRTAGSFEAWRDAMSPHRRRPLFRFLLAAGFAAPLLKLLGQRIFMVYVWGNSRSGKTASLYAALSAWGNPEALSTSFNATLVGIERVVSFFSDLPLGLNERQLGNDRQGTIDKLVYLLSEGRGRIRGAREGGLQQQSTWRSVILSNGEQPLSGSASQTGVSTRALELFGKPFEAEEDASAIYTAVSDNYGHAGARFIRHLVKMEEPLLARLFGDLCGGLSSVYPHNRSHAASVAVVCCADCLASQWLWDEPADAAYAHALNAGNTILGMLGDDSESDVNVRAYRFIRDWAQANKPQFSPSAFTRQLGFKEDDSGVLFIFPSILEEELESHGFSYQKTLRWMAENGRIAITMEDGRTRYQVRKRIDNQRHWMVKLLPDNDDTGIDDNGFTIVREDQDVWQGVPQKI